MMRVYLWELDLVVVLVAGGLCDHIMPHSPCRFKLLLVTDRLAAMSSTLVANAWFCRTAPARPLPACKSAATCFNDTVKSSMLLVATWMLVPLAARRVWACSPSCVSSWEKETRLLTATPAF